MTANDYQFQKLCESIFALSSGIRFIGVIDRMGRLIAGGMRKGVTSMGNFWISVCCYLVVDY
jgi:hypothetical protein